MKNYKFIDSSIKFNLTAIMMFLTTNFKLMQISFININQLSIH